MFVYRCVCWSLYLTLSALFFVHHKTAFIFNFHVGRFLKSSISFDSDEIRIKEKSVFFDYFRNRTPSKDDCRMNSTIKQIETDFSGFKLVPILDRPNSWCTQVFQGVPTKVHNLKLKKTFLHRKFDLRVWSMILSYAKFTNERNRKFCITCIITSQLVIFIKKRLLGRCWYFLVPCG